MKNDLIIKNKSFFYYRVLRTFIIKNKSFSIVASQFIKFIFNAVLLILHIDFMNIFYYRVLRTFIIKSKANIVCFAYYYKRQLISYTCAPAKLETQVLGGCKLCLVYDKIADLAISIRFK